MAHYYKLASFHARSPQTEYKCPSFNRALSHFNTRIVYRIRREYLGNLRNIFSQFCRVCFQTHHPSQLSLVLEILGQP